jgi:hypothetical protein
MFSDIAKGTRVLDKRYSTCTFLLKNILPFPCKKSSQDFLPYAEKPTKE